MKLAKLLFLNVLEGVKLSFNTKENKEHFELPVADYSDMTEGQIEAKYQEDSLELLKEYNVSLFSKWLFFFICCFTLYLGIHMFVTKSIMCIAPLVLLAPLYKIYRNIRGMSHARCSMIEFLFITQDEINKIKQNT